MLSRFTSSGGAVFAAGYLQMIIVCFLLVVLGASRTLAALRRRDTLQALGASLLVVSGAQVFSMHLLHGAMGFVCEERLCGPSQAAPGIVIDRVAIFTIGLTSVIWGAVLWALLADPVRLFWRRLSQSGEAGASLIERARASLYRAPLVPVPRAAASASREAPGELGHARVLLVVNGFAFATPEAATRVGALLLGTSSLAATMREPGVVVGVPVLVASLGLLVLHRAAKDKALGACAVVGAAVTSLACAALLWVVVGHVPLTWDLLDHAVRCLPTGHISSTPPSPEYQSLRQGCSHEGPLGGVQLFWPSALGWLLKTHVLSLIAVMTLTVLIASRKGPSVEEG